MAAGPGATFTCRLRHERNVPEPTVAGGAAHVSELAVFRDLVRSHRRDVGRSQQQLAVALGLHPNVLSHKLNGHGRAILTVPEVIAIVTTLAQWGAIHSRTAVEELLTAAGVPPYAVPATAWSEPPLSLLPEQSPTARARAPSNRPWEAPSGRSRPAMAAPDGGAAVATATGGPSAEWRLTRPPTPLTRLVGRHDERLQVAAALQEARLVTLTGVGGTGKTRLAVQVAADLASHYRDGVGFVDLTPVASPSLLAGAIATACGLAPRAREGEPALIDSLEGRDLLLVVDNLEHLLEGATVLSRLLEGVPGLQVLATSRVALRLYGEHVVRVPSLAVTEGPAGPSAPSDAVRLFLERAVAAGQRPGDAPEELQAVRDICAAVDGLPLAIELAAAKTRVYPPQELLRLMWSRAPVLDSGPRDAPDRQRTLRATLDWSFQLLSQDAQRLLACVGIFAGPFDVGDADAVSGSSDNVEESLSELIDHSLVERRSGSTREFALLQTIREYALARLAESGEQEAVERRNLGHHLDIARRVLGTTAVPTSEDLASLESAHPNIRVALDHAVLRGADDPTCLDDALVLANTLKPFWTQRGPIGDGLRYLQGLLDADPDRPSDRLRASVLLNLCSLACTSGDYDLGAGYGGDAIDLLTSLHDVDGLAVAYCATGECHYAVGQLDTAAPMFQRALQMAQDSGDQRVQGIAANMLGQLLNHQGAHEEARRVLCDAVEHMILSGQTLVVPHSVHSLSEALRDAGDVRSSEQLLQAVVRLGADAGDNRVLAAGFEGLAAVASQHGQHAAALRRLGVAQAIRQRIGAWLAPVEDWTLRRAMSDTFTTTTNAEQLAAFAAARTVAPQDLVPELLENATAVVASGSQRDILAWISTVVAAGGWVPER